MRNVNTTLHAFFFLFVIGCGVPQADFDTLKEENEKLKKEIAECQLTPSEILEQAEQYREKKDYAKSRDFLKTLISKYTFTNEGKKAKSLLKKVEKDIIETARTPNKENTENKEEEKEEAETEVAEEEISEARRKENEKAISKMKKKYDINDHVTWYSDKSSIQSATKNYIQTYVGKKEKKPWLGLSINYFTKKKWLHIERIEINAGGEIFEITEDTPGEFKEKEESGGKREWLDRVIKKKDILMIKKIASSKTTKLKFVGKDNVYKRTVSKTERKAIQNVLAAYTALGGNL